MLLTLPLVPLFMWLIGRATERRARERWQALRLLAAHFLDVVRGLPTLRAFNRGEAQTAEIARVADEYRRTTMGTLRVAFLSGAVLELAATLGIALVAVTVGVRLVDGGIGFEAALTVLVLAPELYLPLRNLGAQFHASADGIAVAGRLLDLRRGAARRERRHRPRRRARATRRSGSRASRSPTPTAAPVLDGVDLELAPGETVALVGASGAGKSTVASLLLRLAEPTGGRITAGGVDLAACDAAAWRAQLAWVPQRVTLFRGTVADNIRLGDAGADDARVREAAALAARRRLRRARCPRATTTRDRRRRPAAVGGPGAADRARARVPARRAARDPRRADRRPRPRERGARRRGGHAARRGPHGAR